MNNDTNKHARSCQVMLLAITMIDICKKVTEIVFYNISRNIPVHSQHLTTVLFIASAPGGTGIHFRNR